MCLEIKSNAPRRPSRIKKWLHFRLQGPGPMNSGSAVHDNIDEQIETYLQCEERESFMEDVRRASALKEKYNT